jgi:hypothetical protein
MGAGLVLVWPNHLGLRHSLLIGGLVASHKSGVVVAIT